MLGNSCVSEGLVGSEEEVGPMQVVKIGKVLAPASLKVTIRLSPGRLTGDQKNIRTGYVMHLTAVKVCTNLHCFATAPAN
jgi:hypothetical protein